MDLLSSKHRINKIEHDDYSIGNGDTAMQIFRSVTIANKPVLLLGGPDCEKEQIARDGFGREKKTQHETHHHTQTTKHTTNHHKHTMEENTVALPTLNSAFS